MTDDITTASQVRPRPFKREKRDVHGWVILDKPVGMTSTQAVGALKRLFKAKRAGHAGTLDPLASGVLPVALGEATKTVPFVMDGRKRYQFTVRWGEERDTDYVDLEHVRAEVATTRRLYEEHDWPAIDVSRRSIEETAAAILNLLTERQDSRA